MALGKVTVNTLNLAQGEFPTVEKHFLFVGTGPAKQGDLVFLNSDSDLDAELGAADSDIKTQVKAAKANAGENWGCIAAPLADGTLWNPAVDEAMEANAKIEAIVICSPIAAQADLTAMQTKAANLISTYARRVFFIASTAALDIATQSWAQYITAMTALTNLLRNDRVMVAPKIYPDWPGIVAGRLCNSQTSIADSPMRVATGAIVGRDISGLPKDSANIRYNNAHAKALNDQRFTVPQLYPDYPGVYCSDGQTLDTTEGDYAVIENERVADKAARGVRLVAIGLIADRRLNSTPISEAWAINKMMRPLREMSRAQVFHGIPFPGEIYPPKEGDIAILWRTRTKVEIYLKVRPLEAGKEITTNIVLDLETPALITA